MCESVPEAVVDIDERQSIVAAPAVRAYPFVNGLASCAELVGGVLSGNIAVAVDGIHGSAEIVVANTQINHAHEVDAIDRGRRKVIYTAISGLALTAAGVAGAEAIGILNLSSENIAMDVFSWTAAGLAMSSAVLASRAIIRRTREKYGKFRNASVTETEHDITRHIVYLDTPSASLAFLSASARIASLIWQGKGIAVTAEEFEHGVGVASGLLGAWLFRPTEKNLQHTV